MEILYFFRRYKKKTEYEKQLDAIHKELHELRRLLMATKQEVLNAIATEKEQVLGAVEDLNAQIQALKDQIEAGTAVTTADLDDILTAVNDIFIPPVV
jgi:predicted  nucleic acid-binding Zn-ribbon protein